MSEEHSPTFFETQWRLVDALALQLRGTNSEVTYSSHVVGQLLDVAGPIVLPFERRSSRRQRIRSASYAVSQKFGTGTVSPNWCSRPRTLRRRRMRWAPTLKQLSSDRSIVHFGKATKELGWLQRVYRFDD